MNIRKSFAALAVFSLSTFAHSDECALRVAQVAEQLDAMYAAEPDSVRQIAVTAVLGSLCGDERFKVYTTRGLGTDKCDLEPEAGLPGGQVVIDARHLHPKHPDYTTEPQPDLQ